MRRPILKCGLQASQIPLPSLLAHPSIALAFGEDVFADASSAWIADIFEGETYTVTMEITNKGGRSASNVDIGV